MTYEVNLTTLREHVRHQFLVHFFEAVKEADCAVGLEYHIVDLVGLSMYDSLGHFFMTGGGVLTKYTVRLVWLGV